HERHGIANTFGHTFQGVGEDAGIVGHGLSDGLPSCLTTASMDLLRMRGLPQRFKIHFCRWRGQNHAA
ncbi:MAG TPA: hypothetical protein VGC82_22160, partial [Rhodopila sp.]